VGKAGDKVGIYICGIIYPGFQPESEEEPSYQYYGKLLQTVPQQVRFEADAKAGEQEALFTVDGQAIPEEIENTYEAIFGVSLADAVSGQGYVELYKEDSEEAYITGEPGELTLHFQMYGGEAGTYRTTVFVNHEPVMVDGKDYIETQLEENTMSQCDVTLDVSGLSERNTIYAVTVPADENYLEYGDVLKTASRLLVVKE
jgi:PAS domain-containing protein